MSRGKLKTDVRYPPSLPCSRTKARALLSQSTSLRLSERPAAPTENQPNTNAVVNSFSKTPEVDPLLFL